MAFTTADSGRQGDTVMLAANVFVFSVPGRSVMSAASARRRRRLSGRVKAEEIFLCGAGAVHVRPKRQTGGDLPSIGPALLLVCSSSVNQRHVNVG